MVARQNVQPVARGEHRDLLRVGRALDRATEPRTMSAAGREAPSFSSPPTVQVCHLSDPTGSLHSSPCQNGLQRPRTPLGEWNTSRKPVTEPLGR